MNNWLKPVLDDKIEKIREQQAMLNRQRSLAVRLVEACDNLSPDEKWEELGGSDSEVIFVRSKGSIPSFRGSEC